MRNRRHIGNLALVGFMATGKSAVGRLAARRLHFEFLDTDALIESRLGKPISEIFAHEGEAWFRAYEQRLVLELADCQRTVIATGGGLGASEANLANLKQNALVVCLWATPETIWSRARRLAHRPLLQTPDPLARIRQLLALRIPIYRQADVLLSTERRTIKTIADLILQHFRWVTEENADP